MTRRREPCFATIPTVVSSSCFEERRARCAIKEERESFPTDHNNIEARCRVAFTHAETPNVYQKYCSGLGDA